MDGLRMEVWGQQKQSSDPRKTLGGARGGDGDRITNGMRCSSALLCRTVLASPKDHPQPQITETNAIFMDHTRKRNRHSPQFQNAAETVPTVVGM